MIVASALQYARNELEGYIPYVSSRLASGLGVLFTAYHIYNKGVTDYASICGAVFTAATVYLRSNEEVTVENVREKAKQLQSSLGRSLVRCDFDSKAGLFKTRFNSIREVLSQNQAVMPADDYGSCVEHLNGAKGYIENAGMRLGFQLDILSRDIPRAVTSGSFPRERAAFLARYEKSVAAFKLFSPADQAAMRAKGLKFTEIYNALNAPVAQTAPSAQTAAVQNPTQVKIDTLHAELTQSIRDGSIGGKRNAFSQRYVALHKEIEKFLPQNRDPLRPKLDPIYQLLIAPLPVASSQPRAASTAAVSGSAGNGPAEQLLADICQALTAEGVQNSAIFADRFANLPPESSPETRQNIESMLFPGPAPAPHATAQELPRAPLLRSSLRVPSPPQPPRPTTAQAASAAVVAAPALNLAAMPELIGLVRGLRAGTHVTSQNYLTAFRQIMTRLDESGFCDGNGVPNPADFGEIFKKIREKIGLNSLHVDIVGRTQNIAVVDPQRRTLVAVIETGGHFSTWHYQNGNYYCAPEYSQVGEEWLETRQPETLSAETFKQRPNGAYVCIYSKDPVVVPTARGVTAFLGRLPNINSCAIDASIQILARVLPANLG